VICWVYLKGNDTQNHKKSSDEEALMIVKAIAKISGNEKPPSHSLDKHPQRDIIGSGMALQAFQKRRALFAISPFTI
jgi:hypothetical protein